MKRREVKKQGFEVKVGGIFGAVEVVPDLVRVEEIFWVVAQGG